MAEGHLFLCFYKNSCYTYVQSKRDYALKVFQSKELTGTDFAPF